MTKEITKAYILQQLQDKFGLRELDPEKFSFLEAVRPVYDIGPHLMSEEVKSSTTGVTTGPYAYGFFVVPDDERWSLHVYNVIFMTGAYTVAGLMIYRPLVADYIYLDLKAAQNTSYTHFLPHPIELEPGEELRLYVDGYTSTGSLQLRVDVTVEKIR